MAKAEYKSAVRSRKKIKDALADLLQEKPLDKITVTDVVARAQINRGTFYAHYRDVADVIDHLIQETFSRIKEALSETPGDVTQVPGILVKQIHNILENDLDFYKKVMYSGVAQRLQERLVEVVLDYLLQREKDLYIGSHEQYVLTIRFCAGGLGMLYHDWFAGKVPLTLEEMGREAEKMLVGILRQ